MKIENIIFYELPQLSRPYLITALAGWPDAAQIATGTISYLITKLRAKKFAELKGEDFYSFTSLRPEVTIERGIVTSVRYPSYSFFYWQNERSEHDLVLSRGIEPDLHWQGYIKAILDLAIHLKVVRIYTLGGLYDQIPHTREPKVSGVVSEPTLTQLLIKHGIELIDYRGPSSLHSALLAECRQKFIEAISLWGHAPFYIRVETNPIICLRLLQKLLELLEIEIDLKELTQAAYSMQQILDRLLSENDELRLYVRKLEEKYDFKDKALKEPLLEDTDKIIKEVEEFLRRERHKEDTAL